MKLKCFFFGHESALPQGLGPHATALRLHFFRTPAKPQHQSISFVLPSETPTINELHPCRNCQVAYKDHVPNGPALPCLFAPGKTFEADLSWTPPVLYAVNPGFNFQGATAHLPRGLEVDVDFCPRCHTIYGRPTNG